jgi:integrase
MTTILKRGNVYHFSITKGGSRLRGSLGVSDSGAAKRLANRVEFALADGPKSVVWSELKPALPAASFRTLTAQLKLPGETPTLPEFQKSFEANLTQRQQLGQIAASTVRLYIRTSNVFFKWLLQAGAWKMDEIYSADVADYLVSRHGQILRRNPDKGARGLETESKILRALFSFAVESGAIPASPLKELYKSDVPADEPEPFTEDELQKMDEAAEGEIRLIYLLFRWTGLRVSDVAALPWGAINLDKRTLTWLTQKRKKLVCIPLSEELTAELKWNRAGADEKIIPGATRARLYTAIKALGVKAGVENVHPHRFRANFACFLLSKGATLHDVSAILGDTCAAVETYYARFTDGAKERIKNVLSS